MCGIFGSNNKQTFLDLYYLNKERGDFSYGCYYIGNNECALIKSQEGPSSIDKIPDAAYYIGHTRAPTSTRAEFNPYECHPFVHNEYIFAHNGIIDTVNLEFKYGKSLPVDSMWLHTIFNDGVDVKQLESNITGTYAVWAVNVLNKDISLFRSSNPIHWNAEESSFSSIRPNKNYKLLDEGKIYSFNPLSDDDIKVINTFTHHSPYFIPGD